MLKNKTNNLSMKLKTRRGFTLIEMMVAVSIFVIVAFIVVSTLLTMSYAYKKAQKMRLIMDNFNFSLQSMSLGIREGTAYQTVGCSPAGTCFGFKPVDAAFDDTISDACYSLGQIISGKGTILKCSGSCPCTAVEENRFTSSDINVTNLNFITTTDEVGLLRSKVKILIQGTAGTGRELVEFFIQNTVSQRNPN